MCAGCGTWLPPAGWARPPVGGSGPGRAPSRSSPAPPHRGRPAAGSTSNSGYCCTSRLRGGECHGEVVLLLKIPVIGAVVHMGVGAQDACRLQPRLQQGLLDLHRSLASPLSRRTHRRSSSRYRGISSLASSTQVLPFTCVSFIFFSFVLTCPDRPSAPPHQRGRRRTPGWPAPGSGAGSGQLLPGLQPQAANGLIVQVRRERPVSSFFISATCRSCRSI